MENSKAIEEAIKARINARHGKDYVWTELELGLLRVTVETDPALSEWHRERFEHIEAAIADSGAWGESYEWYRLTDTFVRVERKERHSQIFYDVTVSCGHQVLSCTCLDLPRAYMFMTLYEHIIREGFYSIGEPLIWNR